MTLPPEIDKAISMHEFDMENIMTQIALLEKRGEHYEQESKDMMAENRLAKYPQFSIMDKKGDVWLQQKAYYIQGMKKVEETMTFFIEKFEELYEDLQAIPEIEAMLENKNRELARAQKIIQDWQSLQTEEFQENFLKDFVDFWHEYNDLAKEEIKKSEALAYTEAKLLKQIQLDEIFVGVLKKWKILDKVMYPFERGIYLCTGWASEDNIHLCWEPFPPGVKKTRCNACLNAERAMYMNNLRAKTKGGQDTKKMIQERNEQEKKKKNS